MWSFLVREKQKTPTKGKPDGPGIKRLLSYPQISQASKTIVGFGETVIFPVDGSEVEQNLPVTLFTSGGLARCYLFEKTIVEAQERGTVTRQRA